MSTQSTNPATFEAFEADFRAQGFDEILARDWAPGQVVGTHSHPFDVKALVVHGQFTLHCGEGAAASQRVVHAGEWFELPRNAPHTETYGPEGATFWAARRHKQADPAL